MHRLMINLHLCCSHMSKTGFVMTQPMYKIYVKYIQQRLPFDMYDHT